MELGLKGMRHTGKFVQLSKWKQPAEGLFLWCESLESKWALQKYLLLEDDKLYSI
jgi:hypothetical protein